MTLRTTQLILTATLLLIGLSVPAPASAQELDVDFERTPLFEDSNLLPGTTISREAVVTNNSEEDGMISTHTSNETSCPGSPCLEEALEISITSGETVRFAGTLDEFYDEDLVELGSLSAGGSQTYIYTLTFPESKGNQYQGLQTGFNLSITIEGGESVTDDDDLNEDNNNDNGPNGQGGIGGNSGFGQFDPNQNGDEGPGDNDDEEEDGEGEENLAFAATQQTGPEDTTTFTQETGTGLGQEDEESSEDEDLSGQEDDEDPEDTTEEDNESQTAFALGGFPGGLAGFGLFLFLLLLAVILYLVARRSLSKRE